MKKIFLLLLIVASSTMAIAQISKTQNLKSTLNKNTKILEPEYQDVADSIYSAYADSLSLLSNFYSNTMGSISLSKNQNLLGNPYYYRLFANPLVYHSPLKQAMRIGQEQGPFIDKQLNTQTTLNDFFLQLYLKQPFLVNNTEEVLEKQQAIRQGLDQKVDYKVQVSEIVKPKEVETVVEPIEAISRKPNFWSVAHSLSLQLMQNYFSDNWYQGGQDYNSLLASYRLTANYNNREKITFNNTLEMQLGFQTDKDDDKHKFKTNTDLLRMTNQLGIQATGHWYYSSTLQSWTQFYPKFNSNSDDVTSDFMSPFESRLSLGMKYSISKSKYNLNVELAPLAFGFKYVDRDNLINRHIRSGYKHNTYETFGSSILARWGWQILKELRWDARLYYFTNYEKVQVEWENTFNFTINKYLSSKLYMYPRFDDSYKSSKSHAVIQFKEWLSLGLNLSF